MCVPGWLARKRIEGPIARAEKLHRRFQSTGSMTFPDLEKKQTIRTELFTLAVRLSTAEDPRATDYLLTFA